MGSIVPYQPTIAPGTTQQDQAGSTKYKANETGREVEGPTLATFHELKGITVGVPYDCRNDGSDLELPDLPPPGLKTHLHGRWILFKKSKPVWMDYKRTLYWRHLPSNVSFDHIHWLGRVLPLAFPDKDGGGLEACFPGHYIGGHERDLYWMYRAITTRGILIVDECDRMNLPYLGIAKIPDHPINQKTREVIAQ